MSISPSRSSGSYYPKATSSNEQASSSNSSSQSRPFPSYSPIMDEDILPPNQFPISGVVDSIDLEEGTIGLRISKKDAKRLNITLAKHLVKEGMSVAALEKCREISSSHETIKIQTAALQQLEHIFDAEFQILDKKIQEDRASKEEEQRYAAVINKRMEFKKHAANSIDKEKLLKDQWEIQIAKYHRFFRDLFKNLNQKIFDKIYETFYSLRKIDPQSIDPFLPLFISPFLFLFPDEFIQEVLKEWHEIQPHLAYGIPFSLAVIWSDSDLPFKQRAWKDMLQHLKKLYPKNLLLLTKLEETTDEAAFQQISHCLTEGINLIRLSKFEDAASFLSDQRPYFEGWAFWYRYLALTLALNDNPKAFAMMAKALLLPNMEDGFVPSLRMSKFLFSVGKKCFQIPEIEKKEKKTNEVKSKTEPDPLQKFFRVIQDKNKPDKVVASIEDFIQECILCFKEGNPTKNLPFIYFGVQWLTSHMPLDKDFKEIALIFESLFELLSCCTNIMFSFNYEDPWFLETFTLVSDETGECKTIVDFSKLCFGETIKLPEMQFEGVELSVDSRHTMLIVLAKQLHLFIMSVMANPSFQEIDWDFSTHNIHLPNSVGIFMNTLNYGFRMGIQKLGRQSQAFKNAKYWLQVYLDATEKPYDLDDSFIKWSQLALLSCSDSNNIETFEVQWTRFQRLLKPFKIMSDRDVERLCLRDALSSQTMLTELADKISYIENDSVYSFFVQCQNMLGWNLNESFEAWGQRLLNEKGNVKDLLVNNMPSIYRSFLNFFIEFYQKTLEKNQHIALGGDEDTNQQSTEWGRGIENLWLQIVRENKPKLYPNYIHFSSKDQIDLQRIVKNKHDHEKEVEELRGIYRTFSQENIPVLMSAVLLRAALHERSETHHSVYVETEEEARQIYQILLNVSVDRLIRYHLISLSYSHWKVENIPNPESFFGEILAPLIGAFHGPETHITGNGPIQSHYNAGIVIPGGSVINTHIYYGP